MSSNTINSNNKQPNFYKIALNKAKNMLLTECNPKKEHLDDILTNMQYIKNWKIKTNFRIT